MMSHWKSLILKKRNLILRKENLKKELKGNLHYGHLNLPSIVMPRKSLEGHPIVSLDIDLTSRLKFNSLHVLLTWLFMLLATIYNS